VPAGGMGDEVVTYQPSCHLSHAQRIKKPPRDILSSIPGLRLVEMEDAEQCCGSAGIYSVVEHDMSMQVLDRKMEAVADTQARIIATANSGCMLQLQAGVKRAGIDARVVHVIDLLAEAYRAERNGAPPAHA